MARVQVPNLITPIIAGTSEPPNLPSQQLPDVAQRMKEGVEAGNQLIAARKIAAQTAAQSAAFEYQKEMINQYKEYKKYVDAQPWDAGKKAAYLDLWGAEHGMSFNTQTGATMTPGAWSAPFVGALQQRATAGDLPQGTNVGDEITKYYPNLYPTVNMPAAPLKPPQPVPAQNNGSQQPVDTGVTAFGGTVGQ